MATKKANPVNSLIDDLMGEIDDATASRPKGKFLSEGRYILKVTNAGIQQGKKFTGWTCDAEVMSTTADFDKERASKPGDGAVIMWKQNDSLPGNLKAVEQSLGVDRRALLDGSALIGKLIKVTATEGKTKEGKPFTFITITGFAEEDEARSLKPSEFVQPMRLAPAPDVSDDEPPF